MSDVGGGWRAVRGAVRTIDWALVIVVAGFVVVAPVGVLFGRDATSLLGLFASRPNPARTAYAASISAAAVKRPEYVVPLEKIPPSMASVEVVTLSTRLPPTTNRTFDIWVSLPSQLRAACAGAADPVRRLQEILGMPPREAKDQFLVQLTVPRTGLFRPCAVKSGGDDLAAPNCPLDFPSELLPDSADEATVRAEYKHVEFVTRQMWSSYRPDGYPFTGMGWTYDWSNVPNHVGVSEFIVRRGAEITVIGTKTPAEFCTVTAAPEK